MAERHYTIMIVPGTKAKLLRLRIRRGVLLGIASVALFGVFTVGVLPLIYYNAARRSQQLDSLKQENKVLRKANKELASLRDQVAFFENKASQFALLAGVENLPSSMGVGGLRPDGAAREAALPMDGDLDHQDGGEIEDLKERSGVLSRSFELLEKVYHDQSLLLSSTPSITPVKGMIAYGFSWRKDPFTGQRAFHTGLDIVAPRGSRVKAPADAVVVKAAREGGYGNVVYLSHGNGLTTRYAHLDGFAVRTGQEVARGDIIGYIGDTGRSLGAHLHYEVLVNNTKVDPARYILDERATY